MSDALGYRSMRDRNRLRRFPQVSKNWRLSSKMALSGPLNDVKRKTQSVLRLLRSDGPEKEVSKYWLLRTAGGLDRKFAKSNQYSFSDFGEYSKIKVNDQILLWPRDTPRGGILRVISEIMNPDHPHQYVYGRTTVHKNDVVLDIGACEGAFSAVVTARCKQVIAIEPSRTMCRLIRDLFKLRDEPCPDIFNCLLGDKSATAYFMENTSNPGASRICWVPAPGAYQVPVRTLDELVETLEHKPTFIKCDAEGAEHAIFSGGKNFLSEYRPKLAVTTYHNDEDYAAMHALLTSLKYNVAGKGLLYSPSEGTLRVQMIHAW